MIRRLCKCPTWSAKMNRMGLVIQSRCSTEYKVCNCKHVPLNTDGAGPEFAPGKRRFIPVKRRGLTFDRLHLCRWRKTCFHIEILPICAPILFSASELYEIVECSAPRKQRSVSIRSRFYVIYIYSERIHREHGAVCKHFPEKKCRFPIVRSSIHNVSFVKNCSILMPLTTYANSNRR
jgi:hypothetical protein